VHSEPDNPVIGPRAWGTTPAQVAANAGAWLAGFQGSGVASCLKHAPGHGDTRTDSHLALPVCDADAATLEAREFAPFRSHPHADALMTAHVVYPALDPGVPATYSRAIVQGVLRERLGFQGVVITDALEMQGAAAGRTPAEAGLAALAAGCDLLLYAHWNEDVRRARYTMADAVVEGRVDRELFDATRPRLAAFDAAHAEPTTEGLAMPIEDLTPRDWEPRLAALITGALKVDGHALDAGGWRVVEESEWKHGPTFATALRDAGIPDGGAAPSVDVIAIASRVPLTAERIASLRAHASRGRRFSSASRTIASWTSFPRRHCASPRRTARRSRDASSPSGSPRFVRGWFAARTPLRRGTPPGRVVGPTERSERSVSTRNAAAGRPASRCPPRPGPNR
jgi:hypothetical protein